MLAREEKETIILFNEADDTASCFTYNGRLTKRLTILSRERPDECRIEKDNGADGITFTFPKKWVKVNPTRILSDEQRTAIAERLHSASK
jgi:hypothetical protein